MKLPKYSITFFGTIFLVTFAILMYILFSSISGSLEEDRERKAAEAAESSRLAAEASAIDPFKPSESSKEESSSQPIQPQNSSNSEEESSVFEESSREDNSQEIMAIAQQYLDTMTLEDKLYQMLIITPEALTGYQKVTAGGDVTRAYLEYYPVGGLIYDADNIVSPDQITTMLSNTQSYSYSRMALPLFTCIIEEGGNDAPIASNGYFEVTYFDALSNAASGDDARTMGRTIGQYLSQYGFNFNFSSEYAAFADSFSEGLHQADILSALWFDSSMTASSIADKSFDAIIVDHKNSTSGLPASLSADVVTDLIRNQAGFDGLIITAPLTNSEIYDNYYSGDAAVKAVQAGCDMLLRPYDYQAAYSSLLQAVRSGQITESRINESLLRILYAKYTIMMIQ